MNNLDAARQIIRYALEEEACWHRLHGIVEEERERLWPSGKPNVVRLYGGPKADWKPTDRGKGRTRAGQNYDGSLQ
jgi:hypothetical protein